MTGANGPRSGRLTLTPRPELADLTAKIFAAVADGVLAREYPTVLSALLNAFSVVVAGEAFVLRDDKDEQERRIHERYDHAHELGRRASLHHLARLRAEIGKAAP